jgi:hypothetical protein
MRPLVFNYGRVALEILFWLTVCYAFYLWQARK